MKFKDKLSEIGFDKIATYATLPIMLMLNIVMVLCGAGNWGMGLINAACGVWLLLSYIRLDKRTSAAGWRSPDSKYRAIPTPMLERAVWHAYDVMSKTAWRSEDYRKESKDCDDYAQKFVVLAKEYVRRNDPQSDGFGIPFAVFPYIKDNGEGHAIVEAVSDAGMRYFSPYPHEGDVKLSKRETSHAWWNNFPKKLIKKG